MRASSVSICTSSFDPDWSAQSLAGEYSGDDRNVASSPSNSLQQPTVVIESTAMLGPSGIEVDPGRCWRVAMATYGPRRLRGVTETLLLRTATLTAAATTFSRLADLDAYPIGPIRCSASRKSANTEMVGLRGEGQGPGRRVCGNLNRG